MSWVAVGAAAVTVVGGIYTQSQQDKAIKKAAEKEQQAQQAALDYLRETERVPRQFRDEALTKLGGFYGLEGGEGSQEELIERARESAYFKGMQDVGEEAVLRHAAATGGFRSGNVKANLAKYNQQLLAESIDRELAGLQKMAQQQTDPRSVADVYLQQGTTMSQADIARAQLQSDLYGDITSAGSDAVRAYGASQQTQQPSPMPAGPVV